MRPERFGELPVPIGLCHLWSNHGTTEYDCDYCGEHRKWTDSGTQRCPAREVAAALKNEQAKLAGVREALDAVESILAFSSRDWGQSRDLASLYGIFLGWDPDEGETDEDACYPELVARLGWSDEHVESLRKHFAAIAAFRGGDA